MAETYTPLFEFDVLQMYFGDDYKINDKITIHQPSIQEIVDWGEHRYYSMVHTLCSIPSDAKSALYDDGIDWEEISDFEYFIKVAQNYQKSETSIIFGELDFTSMVITVDSTNGQLILYDTVNDIKIDTYMYQKMIDYVRQMHQIVPSPEKAFNKRTKLALIEFDRAEKRKASQEKRKSILQPLISAMVNSAGFKYKLNELREIKIVEFMDSVKRIQVIKSADALLSGTYSMVDTKKINKKDYDWTRELTSSGNRGENLRIPNKENKA